MNRLIDDRRISGSRQPWDLALDELHWTRLIEAVATLAAKPINRLPVVTKTHIPIDFAILAMVDQKRIGRALSR